MRKILLLIHALCFVYVVAAQSWTPADSLTGTEAYHMDNMGSTVELSENGTTAIVGAPRAISPNADQGKAYILQKSGDSWKEQQIIKPPDGAGDDWFGTGVDIAADGNTVIIGAPRKAIDEVPDQGKVYIYARSGSTWSMQAEFTDPPAGMINLFGESVSLSGDGNIAMVGAKEGNGGKGKVLVYTRTGTTWTYQTTLAAADGKQSDDYGISVDLSKDGYTAAIGASRVTNNLSVTQSGKVYVYTRSGNTWTEQAKVVPPDIIFRAHFGHAVEISAEGNAMLIGAPYWTGAFDSQGKVYYYTRNGSVWTYQFSFTSSEAAIRDYFGGDISLSDDGNIVVLGTNHKQVDANVNQGKVYTYVRNGTSWVEQGSGFSSVDAKAGDYFGTTALSGDGSTLLVGALSKSGAFDFQGKVYFYDRNFVTSAGDKQAFQHVVMYPNPTSGSMDVNLGRTFTQLEIEMYDLSGVLVQKQTLNSASRFQIEMEVPKGIYFVRMISIEGNQTSFRVVKE